jgi:hypothetical protein
MIYQKLLTFSALSEINPANPFVFRNSFLSKASWNLENSLFFEYSEQMNII